MRAEIEICGAGPVGCVLALLLSASDKSVALVGAPSREKEKTFRPIALSHASRLILERVGAWAALSPTPIERIRVSQQGAFGRARLDARDAGVPALGYVVAYSDLLESLLQELARRKIPLEAEASEALLAVHAEGISDDAREKRYPHDALVAAVSVEPAAAATAWERFTPEGPLALLPLARRYAVVWAMRPEKAQALAAAPAAAFLGALQEAFGGLAGRFSAVAERAQVPLALRVRAARLGPRAAYVGNSAQALHPVAGQGFNLGLRDAAMLAEVLFEAQAQRADCGAPEVLARFERSRAADRRGVVWFTDTLVRGFGDARAGVGLLRDLGLLAFDLAPPAKRALARVSAGFGGPTSRLARGLPLRSGS